MRRRIACPHGRTSSSSSRISFSKSLTSTSTRTCQRPGRGIGSPSMRHTPRVAAVRRPLQPLDPKRRAREGPRHLLRLERRAGAREDLERRHVEADAAGPEGHLGHAPLGVDVDPHGSERPGRLRGPSWSRPRRLSSACCPEFPASVVSQ